MFRATDVPVQPESMIGNITLPEAYDVNLEFSTAVDPGDVNDIFQISASDDFLRGRDARLPLLLFRDGLLAFRDSRSDGRFGGFTDITGERVECDVSVTKETLVSVRVSVLPPYTLVFVNDSFVCAGFHLETIDAPLPSPLPVTIWAAFQATFVAENTTLHDVALRPPGCSCPELFRARDVRVQERQVLGNIVLPEAYAVEALVTTSVDPGDRRDLFGLTTLDTTAGEVGSRLPLLVFKDGELHVRDTRAGDPVFGWLNDENGNRLECGGRVEPNSTVAVVVEVEPPNTRVFISAADGPVQCEATHVATVPAPTPVNIFAANLGEPAGEPAFGTTLNVLAIRPLRCS